MHTKTYLPRIPQDEQRIERVGFNPMLLFRNVQVDLPYHILHLVLFVSFFHYVLFLSGQHQDSKAVDIRLVSLL